MAFSAGLRTTAGVFPLEKGSQFEVDLDRWNLPQTLPLDPTEDESVEVV
jgi:hypothetical protein